MHNDNTLIQIYAKYQQMINDVDFLYHDSKGSKLWGIHTGTNVITTTCATLRHVTITTNYYSDFGIAYKI